MREGRREEGWIGGALAHAGRGRDQATWDEDGDGGSYDV